MPQPRVWRDKVRESGTWWHRALMRDRNGNICVQGDYTGSALVQVYDYSSSNLTTAVYSNVRTIAAVLTNTVQTWDASPNGYNLEVAITSNSFTRDGSHTYRTEVSLTHSVEGEHREIFEVAPLEGFGI